MNSKLEIVSLYRDMWHITPFSYMSIPLSDLGWVVACGDICEVNHGGDTADVVAKLFDILYDVRAHYSGGHCVLLEHSGSGPGSGSGSGTASFDVEEGLRRAESHLQIDSP